MYTPTYLLFITFLRSHHNCCDLVIVRMCNLLPRDNFGTNWPVICLLSR